MDWSIQFGSDHAIRTAPDLQAAFAAIADVEGARNTRRGDAVLLTSPSGIVRVVLEPEGMSLDAWS